jgi:hypothetical protein
MPSIVQLGTSRKKLTRHLTGTNDGKTSRRLTYSYVYPASAGPIDGEGTIYESPIFHHVIVNDLKPGQQYYYRVGSGKSGWSEIRSFTVPANKYPFKVSILGDEGQQPESRTSFRDARRDKPDVVIMLGDLSYTDNYFANGTFNTNTTSSYQPRWDDWGRLVDPLVSTVPTQSLFGNHELELLLEEGSLLQKCANSRFPVPQNVDVINTHPNHDKLISANKTFLSTANALAINNTWYSIDLGPLHFISLNNYAPYGPGSNQYKWFIQDIESVDRAKTPWIVVGFHATWYSSFTEHFKENEEMRKYYEPIFYKHAVDLVLNAHVHCYERAKRMYQWEENECGPMYVTNGHTGFPGDYELVERDPPAFCATGKIKMPYYQPTYSGDGWVDPNIPRCFYTKPSWSAYREGGKFGRSTATFLSDTQFEWKMFLNEDAFDTPSDSVLVTKPPASCNRG